MPEAPTARRKDAHLDLCAQGDVEPDGNSTLLDCVHLVHNALPELALDEVELTLSLWGKVLRAPLLVTGMTGGTDRAREVNRDLAQVAERHGLAFGVGSQRAMAENPELARTFQVRDVAPHVLLIGNIGLKQAIAMGVDGVRRLVDGIDADGLALHLNAAQELSQPEGDRDFRGGYSLVQALASAFGERFLVKETGCGIAPTVARRLVDCGVRTLDVSGLGGTSWVRVEQLRAAGQMAELGALFSSWGIPTAAAVATVRRAVGPSVKIVASGGIRDGLDVAKVLAIGADLAGMALPLFRAQQAGGVAGADAAVRTVVAGLRQALLLTSSRTVADLRRSPRVVTAPLKDWMESL
ncbi:MAG TPA: type 2 isopentenyl-diphosphate Delta-isomerase [Myxococcaceae bacterium]